MTAQIIDGTAIAQKVRDDVKAKVAARIAAGKSQPGLATVLVGDRVDSAAYVGMKQKACAELGMTSYHHPVPADVSQEELEKLIKELQGRDVKTVAPWLHTVTRNHCLMILRAASRAPVKSGLGVSDRIAEAEEPETPQLEERLQGLESAVLQLEENQQICVSLFYLKEQSYREICAVTGFSELQVKSDIQNGRRNLRHILVGRS